MQHHDSNGGGGLITDGDTQWMTAGAGSCTSRRRRRSSSSRGGLFHGFQLWVNLPRAEKMRAPRYQDLRGGEVTLLTTPDGGALLRLIAGDLDGHRGPGSTFTPITLVHATVAAGAELRVPWAPDFNGLAYVLGGAGTVGAERRPIRSGQLAVFGADGDTLVVTADEAQESRAPALDVLLLGGRPIREPVAWYGPFVMNTDGEVRQAFADFQAGRLGRIPAHHAGGNVDPTR